MILKKKSKFIVCSALLLVVSAVGVGIYSVAGTKNEVSETVTTRASQGIHKQAFWDEPLFNVAVAEATTPDQYSAVLGAVIPHHLIANHLIIDLLLRLQKNPPKHIVLLTPNHYEEGSTPAITSDKDWETPFGTYKTQYPVVQSLIQNPLISIEHEAIAKEHAIAGLVHYFQFFLPESEIIPIAVSNTLTFNEIQALTEVLQSGLPKDAVIITSVDFSHYLSSEESEKRDEVTLAAIKKEDYAQILSFSNEYVDSPSALLIHLLLMEKVSAQLTTVENTNSGILLNEPYTEGTSYFELIWE